MAALKKLDKAQREELWRNAKWHLERGHKLKSFNFVPSENKSDHYKNLGAHKPMSRDALKDNILSGKHQAVYWMLERGDGILVVDVDDHDGSGAGFKEQAKLTEQGALPPTRVIASGGGGFHHIYEGYSRDNFPLRSTPAIQYLDNTGLIIAGSMHKTQKQVYRVHNDIEPAQFPKKLFEVAGISGLVPKGTAGAEDWELLLDKEDLGNLINYLRTTEPPESRDEWVRCLYSARNITLRAGGRLDPVAEELMEWCARGANYHEGGDAHGIRTIFYSDDPKKRAGFGIWQELKKRQENTFDDGLFLPLFDENEGAVFVEPLVEDIIGLGATSLMVASENVGKSALAVDLCHKLVTGQTWGGKRVHPGLGQIRALYCAFEGINSVRMRFRQFNRAELDGAVDLLDTTQIPQALATAEARQGVFEAIKLHVEEYGNYHLIVVDTLAEATPGLDENSTDLGAVISWTKQVATMAGGHCLVIHHRAKASQGSRGHTSVPGAADTIFLVDPDPKDDAAAILRISKQRDFPTKGLKLRFEIGCHEFPQKNVFGSPYTVPVVEYTSEFAYDVDGPTARERIVEYIAGEPNGEFSGSQKALAELLEVSQKTVSRKLADLVADGELQKIGKTYKFLLPKE